VLRIFIALKNPSPSAWFEPANLGSNDKDANHYHRDYSPDISPPGLYQWEAMEASVYKDSSCTVSHVKE
jgi:hypothetical protein